MSRPAPPPIAHPAAVRLVRGRLAGGGEHRSGTPTAPPFGLSSWSDSEAAAVVVLLELPADWVPAAAEGTHPIAAQIPPAASLAPGTQVFVLGTGNRLGGLVARILRPRASVARAVRGSALLAQGYVGIRGGSEPRSREDLVWGSVPDQ